MTRYRTESLDTGEVKYVHASGRKAAHEQAQACWPGHVVSVSTFAEFRDTLAFCADHTQVMGYLADAQEAIVDSNYAEVLRSLDGAKEHLDMLASYFRARQAMP